MRRSWLTGNSCAIENETDSYLINSNFLLIKKVETLVGFSTSVFLSLFIWRIFLLLFLICSYALFKRQDKPSTSAEFISILLLVTDQHNWMMLPKYGCYMFWV
jgi:hypothetical protein